ncbi:calcium-dependent serine proteinase-like [Salmo trutta]|uniref:calcium-dependent serine proteinase-like n=1 Tax=Salmo trutta TaxID=8032 RepID=UPI001131A889|nr:calcium-dependent serine proteinase-like [Salmo trutta]
MPGVSLCLFLLPLCAMSMLSGWVESPGYPHGYPPDASLNWSRCAPPGYTLALRLTHLDMEDSDGCENDALESFSDGMQLFNVVKCRLTTLTLPSIPHSSPP